jgi:hypothetical protein
LYLDVAVKDEENEGVRILEKGGRDTNEDVWNK